MERSHGTQQDRLIKKLRLYGIGTMEAANRYLRQHHLPDHNRRFSREPLRESRNDVGFPSAPTAQEGNP